MDVAEAVDSFLDSRHTLSPTTRRGYRVNLGIFAAWCEEHGLQLEQLTSKHIRQFVADVEKRPGLKGSEHLQSATIAKYAINVKTFLA